MESLRPRRWELRALEGAVFKDHERFIAFVRRTLVAVLAYAAVTGGLLVVAALVLREAMPVLPAVFCAALGPALGLATSALLVCRIRTESRELSNFREEAARGAAVMAKTTTAGDFERQLRKEVKNFYTLDRVYGDILQRLERDAGDTLAQAQLCELVEFYKSAQAQGAFCEFATLGLGEEAALDA
jgi:hypothetical protein